MRHATSRARWAVLAVALLVAAAAGGYAVEAHRRSHHSASAAVRVVHDSTRPATTTAADVAQAARSQRSTVRGDDVLLATPRGKPNGRLVVYVHGSDENAAAMIDQSQNAALTVALARAGYAILGDDAGGNAWANPASIASYVAAVSAVPATYRGKGVYLIGESMGGLTSIVLLSHLAKVRAWVGIYPVCNLRSVYALSTTSALHTDVDAAWGSQVGEALNTLSPPTITAAVAAMAFSSPDDVTVRQQVNADACLAQFAHNAPGRATLVSTTGRHGDASNFQPSRVVALFDGAS